MTDPLGQLWSAYETVRALQDQGQDEQAYALALRLLEPARRILGPDHPDVAEFHSTIGILARRTGRNEIAVEQQRLGLDIRLRHFGERDPGTIVSRSNLGLAELEAGDPAAAERNLRRVLDLRRADPAADPVTVAFSRSNLATALAALDRRDDAERELRTAAAELERAGDTADWRAVQTLGGLSQLLRGTNRYAEALPVQRRAVALAERILPDDHYLLAELRVNLGHCLTALGQHAEAADLNAAIASGYERQYGAGDRRTVAAFVNLAGVALLAGRLHQAETAARRALDQVTDGSFEQGCAWQVLGGVHRAMDRAAQAEEDYRRAVAVLEAVDPGSVRLGRALSDLASLHREKGRYGEATPMFGRAVAILRPAGDEQLPMVLNNFGVLKLQIGDHAGAERLWRECVELYRRREYPDRELALAKLTNNLGEVLRDQGRHAEAEPLLREALHQHRELSPDNPAIATNLINVARVAYSSGRAEEAVALLLEAGAVQDRTLDHVVRTSSAAQRREHVDALLSMYYTVLSLAVLVPGSARGIYGLTLRRKGLLAEALLAQYSAATTGAARAVRDELFEAGAELAAAIARGGDEERTTAEQRRDALEERLAQETAGGALPDVLAVTVEAVARALPEGSVLVEYVRFPFRDFAMSPWRPDSWGDARYAAFVLTPDGRVEVADLGAAAPVDALAERVRAALGRGGEGIYADEGEPADPSGPAAALRAAVLDPLRRHVRPGGRLMIAADGTLGKVPFAALPGSGESPLLDDYEISYLTTGRKLPATGVRTPSGPAFVLADPDFGPGGFAPLPGSRAEGVAVAGLLGVPARLGADATGAALAGARAPRILHLATHAYLLPEEDTPLAPGEGGLTWSIAGVTGGEPWTAGGVIRSGPLDRMSRHGELHRSGLAFAGANAWIAGDERAPGDAVLTADRIAALDLRGTEMVVLSACETALGVARPAEGILGLRWACAVAGARSLVVSLWKVPDAETRRFMEHFYRLVLGGEPRAAALRAAQLDQRRRRPDPYFWAAFVLEGEPGPLEPFVPGDVAD